MPKATKFQRRIAATLFLASMTTIVAPSEIAAETSEELIEKKKEIDSQIEALNEEIAELKQQLEKEIEAYNETKRKIELATQEIKALHEKIRQRKDVLQERLKAYQTHESNLNIYVEAVFGSETILDIMSRVSSVNVMIEADRTLYEEFKAEQLLLAEKRVALQKLNDQQEKRYRDMQVQESDLEVLMAEVRLTSLQLEEQIAEAQERERLEAERLAAQRALELLQGPLDATGVDNPPAQVKNIAEGIALAKTYLGMPYLWGGMHPDTSFDCSGLIYWAYRQKGITVPRTSRQQYAATVRVKKEDVLPGDLVFFAYDGRIGHVGIYIGDGLMLNSQNAGVVIEPVAGWQEHFAGYGRVVN